MRYNYLGALYTTWVQTHCIMTSHTGERNWLLFSVTYKCQGCVIWRSMENVAKSIFRFVCLPVYIFWVAKFKFITDTAHCLPDTWLLAQGEVPKITLYWEYANSFIGLTTVNTTKLWKYWCYFYTSKVIPLGNSSKYLHAS